MAGNEAGDRTVVNPIVDALLSDFCARQVIDPGDKAGPALFLAAADVVDSAGVELSMRSLRNAVATQELGTVA